LVVAVIVRGRDLDRDVTLDVDALVVGTGAGGSIALRELARAGLSVVGLEEGAHLVPSDFDQREEHMIPALFRDGGALSTEDFAIRVLQGRGVGGSTVHNTNLCKRTPDEILEVWTRRYAVSGVSPGDLRPRFEQIEKELSVATISTEMRNANNETLARGLSELGWRGGPLAHNRVGCIGSGFCELGCAYDAKQNALKVLVPAAIAAGARVYSDVEVVRVTWSGDRVTGAVAVAKDQNKKPRAQITVRSKVVVLAASAVGSAALAIRSGIPDPFSQAGKGLRLHPSAVVAGLFDSKVEGWRGIPQSYECTEHLSFEEGSDRRVWIVPAFAHPIGAASLLPGFGAEHMRRMRDYPKIAVLTALVHDETSGQIVVEDDRTLLRYVLTESDRMQLAKGLVACGRILFAAGAREVTIPAVPAVRLTRASELDALDTRFVRPHGLPLSSVHPMGTLRMGDDPRTSSVSSQGEHHQVKGLFVTDGSLFPTSLGGPPQISIYAFALHLASHIIRSASKEL
jgi:choline dehydrogenase-like flavoprotein